MNFEKFREERQKYNEILGEADNFFEAFGYLDNGAYSKGAIPKKYKELTGLAISIFSKCEECIAYHLEYCMEIGCTKNEIVEVIKMALVGGGSVLFPWARKTIKMMEELDFQ